MSRVKSGKYMHGSRLTPGLFKEIFRTAQGPRLENMRSEAELAGLLGRSSHHRISYGVLGSAVSSPSTEHRATEAFLGIKSSENDSCQVRSTSSSCFQPMAILNTANRLATLQSLSNSLTFPDISGEHLRSIDSWNSSDTKRNACYFSLQYSYILSQLWQLCSSVDSNGIIHYSSPPFP